MSAEDQAARIARFFAENMEHYRWSGTSMDDPKGEYVCTIEPANPDGLLKASHDHREQRIRIWAEALRASGVI